MVDAVVFYAIEKLGDFLIKEVNIRIRVKDAVIWHTNKLAYLQVSVRALEAKQQTGHIRLWIDSVKDVANEVLIILERFSTHQEEHAAPKQGVLDRMRSCICICKKEADLYEFGKEIESFKKRFDDIKKRQAEYNISVIVTSLSQNQKQGKRIKGLIPFENEVDVVGFKDDVKTLLAELVREDPSLRVISIHGMGGLGKTTIARKLYDSSELSHCKRRAFVCVSQEYDIKDVLKRIIKSVEGPNYEVEYFLKMDELDLLVHLRNLLDGHPYLVVIDDIWDIEAWKIIRKAFPEKKKGSRVIITTRNKDIPNEIKEILGSSFDDLTFQMRQCFLYLARFPEDNTFKVDKLMQLWIAEEFISEAQEDGVVMEDVAKNCLNELINRNMIQIAALKFNGEVEECRVHDLIRDLAIQKAAEDKLLGIFDLNKQHISSISLLQGQPRHAIYNGHGEYFKLRGPSSDDSKLRSLAEINNYRLFKLDEMKLMYTRFKNLKVLDLVGVKSEGIPDEIGDLVLLRFFGLMGGSYEKPLRIPPTIGKLKKLQTLCGLEVSEYEFPREICELKELRHTTFNFSPYKRSRACLNIGSQQTKLKTLDSISYEEWNQIDTTVNFTNLRTLSIVRDDAISKEENVAYTLDSITNLINLQTFRLTFTTGFIPTIKSLASCKRLKTVLLEGKIKDTSELSFLPDSVTCLTLYNSELTQDPVPILGSLSNLTSLHLSYNAYKGDKMVCSPNAFPSL